MRIFYITSVLGVKGGSEIYTKDIISEMVSRGHEVFVCTTELYEIPGTKTLHLPRIGHHATYKFFAPLFYGRVLKAAKEFNPDVIQSHSNSFMGLLGSWLKRDLKKAHFLLIELISSQNKTLHTKFLFQAEKFLLPKLDFNKIIVWTENMKKKFLIPWGIPENKIVVKPASLNEKNYDFDHEKWGKEFKKKYGENLIVSMKTLWSTNVEGIKYIIKAMKIVSKKHPNYKYVIFGEGEKKQSLIKLTKKLGLEKNVIFAGHIYSKDQKKVWAATDIAVHSFVYEFSTSISLLECMAVGNPIVVTDVGSVSEIVKDTALLVPPKDPKAMANGIIKLIENPKLKEAFGRKARKLFKSEYTIQSTVDLMEKLYKVNA